MEEGLCLLSRGSRKYLQGTVISLTSINVTSMMRNWRAVAQAPMDFVCVYRQLELRCRNNRSSPEPQEYHSGSSARLTVSEVQVSSSLLIIPSGEVATGTR